MELGKEHYEALIEDYKEKYLPEEEEEEVSEEQTAVNTASVFTDSFSSSLRSDEKEQAKLLDNLILELNKFAKDEKRDADEYSDALNMAKSVEEKQKKRLKKIGEHKDASEKSESTKETIMEEAEEGEEEMEGKEMLHEDILEEEAEAESPSRDYSVMLEELERMETIRTTKANRELLMKRIYVYQMLDSLIPEYEEELTYYLRDGEDKLLAEDVPTVLQSFGANPTEAESRQIVDKIMRKGGKLSFIDFLVLLADQMKNPYTTKDVIDAFKMMDLNDGGEIPGVILKEVLTTIGERLNETEMEEMMNEADPHKEGFIRYEDFVKRMDKNQYVAVPSKRKALIKILRREERRRKTEASDEGSLVADELAADSGEAVLDPLFNL